MGLIKRDDSKLEVYKDKVLTTIFTRAGALEGFKTINKKSLAKISDRMPDVYRNMNIYARRNSQTAGKLMTLNMISSNPYKRLQQCDVQIDTKREALKSLGFKMLKDNNNIDRLKAKLVTTTDEFDCRDMEIDIAETECNLADGLVHIEHALKEIGMYQDTKEQIMKAHNIPEKWDEKDFEAVEIKEHIHLAFTNLLRDIENTGRVNVGTSEYLEQFGINPQTAKLMVLNYFESIRQNVESGKVPNIETVYEFLNNMYELFKDEYKYSMKRIGIDDLISEEFSYLEPKDDNIKH